MLKFSGQRKLSLPRQILSDSTIYGLGKYLSVVASIFLTPIYTRILTKVDYGVMDIFNTWNTFALVIIPLALPTALIRWYPDHKDDEEYVKKLIGTIIVAISLISGLYLLIMLFARESFETILLSGETYPRIYFLSLITVVFQLYVSVNQQIFRVKFQKWRFLVVALVGFFVLSILGFLLVYHFRRGVVGFFEASAVSVVVSSILCTVLNYRILSFSFSFDLFRKLFKYSKHFISVFILFQATEIVDRLLISRFLGLESVGIYSIAVRFGSLFNLAVNTFAFAWMPIILAMKPDDKLKSILEKAFVAYLYLGLLLVVAICIFRIELIAFFAPQYIDSYNASAGIVLVKYIGGLAYVITLGIHISKRNSTMTTSALFSITANVVLSYFLMIYFGIEGIVAGTLISGVLWVFLQHRSSQKYFKVNYKYSELLQILGILISVIITSFFVDELFSFEINFYSLIIKITLLLIFSILVIKKLGKYNLRIPYFK